MLDFIILIWQSCLQIGKLARNCKKSDNFSKTYWNICNKRSLGPAFDPDRRACSRLTDWVAVDTGVTLQTKLECRKFGLYTALVKGNSDLHLNLRCLNQVSRNDFWSFCLTKGQRKMSLASFLLTATQSMKNENFFQNIIFQRNA